MYRHVSARIEGALSIPALAHTTWLVCRFRHFTGFIAGCRAMGRRHGIEYGPFRGARGSIVIVNCAMQYRRFGRTELQVSELSLGGLFLSKLGGNLEETGRIVRRAVECGINLIDTAPAYADSEEVLGGILRDIDTPLLVSTKLGGRPQPFEPQDRQQLRSSVEQSLRFLHREVIDILMVHEPDRPGQYNWWTNPERTDGPVIEEMADLQQRGLVRFIGLGGTTTTELAHHVRSDRFDVVLTAFNYSALYREAAVEVLPAAISRDMGIMLGSVLQQGGLGRRYDDVVRAKPMWLSAARQAQLQLLYQFLDELGVNIAEFCLRFALSSPVASTILFGPKTIDHVDAAVRAAEAGPLPPDWMERLDDIAALVPFRPFEEPMILPLNKTGPVPWSWPSQRRRRRTGGWRFAVDEGRQNDGGLTGVSAQHALVNAGPGCIRRGASW